MTATRRRVLVVDDDPLILALFEQFLRAEHEVLRAASGPDALALLEREPVDCVVADQMMPGLTGVELLRRCLELRPEMMRILVTASERVENIGDAINVARVHGFLSKPVRMEALRRVVAEALRRSALEEENRALLAQLKERNEQLARALGEVRTHEAKLERVVEERTRALRTAVAELEQLALRDGLTGLYNHRFFQEALTAEIARAARHGHKIGLVFADVDHFKTYNDALGHPAGDELLKELAKILTGTATGPEIQFRCRPQDIAARYGGEEFVLILPETDAAGARTRAERLRAQVAAHPFHRRDVQPGGLVTLSIGVAGYPEHALTKQALIELADESMLLAKRQGRNRVCMAPAPPPPPA